MKKTILILFAISLLVSCGKAETKEVFSDLSSEHIPEDSDAPSAYIQDSAPSREPDEGFVTVCGVKVGWNGYTVIEPDSTLDMENMGFSDFGDFFSTEYPVTTETYKIAEGQVTETTVTHIHSDNPGPCIYIVGAVHGDEKAAVYAGMLMTRATISCGDLYVLSPANSYGYEHNTRYTAGKVDLNRTFPGDLSGDMAEKLAFEIYSDIGDKDPDLMLDLHEAIVYTQGRDFLGSTYIFTDLNGMDDLFFSLLFATQDGTICHNEFSYNGPGPAGSVNAEVTRGLGVPSITVETFRGFDIFRRVQDQLDTIQFVLEYYKMR